MKTLYITDLDGTLLNKRGRLTDFTVNTLNRLISGGADITVATARSPVTALKLLSVLTLTLPAALMNGVLLTDISDGEHKKINSIGGEAVEQTARIFERHGRYPLVYKLDGGLISLEYKKINSVFEQRFVEARKNSYKSIYPDKALAAAENFLYMNCIDSYDRLYPIFTEIKEVDGVKAEMYQDNYEDAYFMEIFSERAGKKNAVAELKALYGFERVIAFGDNNNDIGMFEIADISVAVENANDEVKNHADIIIKSNDEDAVAKYLLEHLG